MAQKRIDNLDYSVVEQIAEHYKSILALIGEDVERDGLRWSTPPRGRRW